MHLFLCLLLVVAAISAVAAGDSRGFGDDIEWFNDLEAAKKASADSGKKIVAIVHKTWCGACKALKPKLASSSDFAEKAKNFIMVNLEDDEEPQSEAWKPDGGYIPRIFVLGEDGNPDVHVKNEGGNPKYGYYYSSDDQLIQTMDRVLN